MTAAPNGGSPPPNFDDPPITEVVAGVAFKPLPALTIPRLCELWLAKWRPTFPHAEEHPPYLPPIERFDMPSSGPTIPFQVSEGSLPTRLWFVTQDGQELIQAQREWFACNWRKVRPNLAYDRWPKRRKAFEKYLGDLQAFVSQEGLGRLTPTQCEVTYVNHVVTGIGLEHLGDLSKLLRVVTPLPEGFPPDPEQMQVAMAFVIRDDHDTAVGRLHVTAQPAIRKEDHKPMVVLTLTARGRPEGEGDAAVFSFLERGREWIVNTFKAITTNEMHTLWRIHA